MMHLFIMSRKACSAIFFDPSLIISERLKFANSAPSTNVVICNLVNDSGIVNDILFILQNGRKAISQLYFQSLIKHVVYLIAVRNDEHA